MVSPRYSIILIFAALMTQCASPEKQAKASCPSVDLTRYDALEINPMSGIEFGEFISNAGRPVSKDCITKRVCETNDIIRKRYSQSYFVNLETYGGQLLSDMFPDIIKQIAETEPGVKHFYLNNFCKLTDTVPSGK